jgi:hypothetical protein
MDLWVLPQVINSLVCPSCTNHQAGRADYPCLEHCKDTLVNGMAHAKIISIQKEQALIYWIA